MIVPHSRLLLWIALLVAPCATLAGLTPSVLWPLILLLALFGSLVAFDALAAHHGLAGIAVQLPEVVRLSKDRPSHIDLCIRNERQRACRLRLGLSLPSSIESPHDEMLAQLPDGAEFSRLRWECTPRQRGECLLEACYLEALSPLKFWAWRMAASVRTEIRVYPNLLQDRKNLAALFLNRKGVGIHAQRQVGQGRDFEKLREYIPGDSFDEIHWKATAKRGHPVTKVFQIERTQEVYVLVDASRLSARVTRSGFRVKSPEFKVPGSEFRAQRSNSELETQNSEPILERFVTSALIFGLVAQRQGDAFGVLSFSDRIHNFVRAKTGKAHYSACRDALFGLQPRLVTPDYGELFSFIRLRLRRRALLLFLTDLDDPVLAESFS
ncbi:MAG: DUF58 domain-containing protein, partial [Acidobacteriales bacterium]|nr:DUF58 domain-containing protein [Terriglobales bacterium]